MLDDSAKYNILAEDTLFSQFTQLAENVRRTLPTGSEGALQISNQVHRLKAWTAEWPEKILETWRAREIPIFSQQAIHKLISANSAWIDEVNEIRKKQKETIKVDINRKKKLLDDIQHSQRQKEDSFQMNLLETQAEMSFFRPTDPQFVQMNRRFTLRLKLIKMPKGGYLPKSLKLGSSSRILSWISTPSV